MSWVAVGLTAAGVVSGSLSAKAKAKENERNAKMAAAQTEFSPWTGAGPGQFSYQDPNAAGQMLGGGANGLAAGMMHNQANTKNPAPTEQPAAQAPTQDMQSPYSSYGSVAEAQGASPWMGVQKKKPTYYGGGDSGFGGSYT